MIVLAADHGGYLLKEEVKKHLDETGVEYIDCGTFSTDSVDYPDIAKTACEKIASGQCSLGLLFCGTGALLSPTSVQQGESIPGICHAVALESEQ